jgi:GT2 family glycosyltransferase
MSLPKVAVVILNWNGKDFLQKFLPNVLNHSPEGSVYVADNASTDDSINLLKEKFPEVKIVINDSNGGFAKGYNDALKKIEAEYYVLLNSDVEVAENWIEPIIKLMDIDRSIAACQPKILDYNNKNKFEYAGAAGGFIDKYGYPFCRGRIFNDIEEDRNQYNDIREIFWATGACMFVRASVYHNLQGFDEDYFAHMEEIDLCWRMKNTGHKIFVVPSSVVYHVGGGTLNKVNPRKTFLNFRNNLTTLVKNDQSGFLFFKFCYRLMLDGVAGIVFVLKGELSHCIAIIKAHFSVYGSLGKTLKKRKEFKTRPNFTPTKTQILNNNIVFLHQIKKVKKFLDIKW